MMMTLRQFKERPEYIPTATSWYLADLGQALGKIGRYVSLERLIEQSKDRL